MIKEIKAKFECRLESIKLNESDEPTIMTSFYNKDGKYIGNKDNMDVLVIKRGIIPETYDECNVCSVGKSLKDGKWYGWSHRAIYGFKIGDTVKKGDCCASSGWTEEYLKTHKDERMLHVGFEAKTDEDCKKMAIAFASSVG